MEYLYDYLSFLQLITATNFIYILGNFYNKIAQLFGTEEKCKHYKEEVANFIELEKNNLSKIKEITDTATGISNTKTIKQTKSILNALNAESELAVKEIQEDIKKIKQISGDKALFSFVSLFGILDILLITIIHVFQDVTWLKWIAFTYVLSGFISCLLLLHDAINKYVSFNIQWFLLPIVISFASVTFPVSWTANN